MSLLLAFCSTFYEDVAINELVALVGGRISTRLAPGTLQLAVDRAPEAIMAHLHQAPPVFTRQLLFVVAEVALSGDAGTDGAALREVTAGAPVIVCDLEGRTVDRFAPPWARPDRMADDDQAVPVDGLFSALPPLAVVVENRMVVGRALHGAGFPSASDDASPWPAGRPRLVFEPDLVSRSALKLLEALSTFTLPVSEGMQALDLGAAPGGWTQILARRGARITTVDPGALDPRVSALPGITVRTCTAQLYLRETSTLFDLIVNDMRLDARDSARLMVQAAERLRPDGHALITLKLPARAPTTILRTAQEILRDAYPIARARCLYFNRNEVTVHLRRSLNAPPPQSGPPAPRPSR